jgi:hypothetical protein
VWNTVVVLAVFNLSLGRGIILLSEQQENLLTLKVLREHFYFTWGCFLCLYPPLLLKVVSRAWWFFDLDVILWYKKIMLMLRTTIDPLLSLILRASGLLGTSRAIVESHVTDSLAAITTPGVVQMNLHLVTNIWKAISVNVWNTVVVLAVFNLSWGRGIFLLSVLQQQEVLFTLKVFREHFYLTWGCFLCLYPPLLLKVVSRAWWFFDLDVILWYKKVMLMLRTTPDPLAAILRAYGLLGTSLIARGVSCN